MKISHLTFFASAGLSLLLSSCHKDTVQRGMVGFTTTAASVSESAGEQTVTISLGESVSTSTKVAFTLGGTASLDGNYSLETTSPITVNAGQSEVTLKFKVIDNKIIEYTPDKYVTFTITSVDNYTTKTTDNLVYTLTIKDNDSTPTAGLQADLTWNLGTGVSINNVNMDLYLVTDVVISNNSVTSFTINKSIYSNNYKGFESYVIPTNVTDTDYYVVAVYDSGSVSVPYLVGLNDATNGYRKASDTFAATDVGQGAFYGPFTKTGTTFSRQQSDLTSTHYKLGDAVLEKIRLLNK